MKAQDEIKFTACNHILQTVQNQPGLGNLYLGGIGSLNQKIIEHYKISAILTLMDRYIYDSKKVGNKIQALAIEKHKWVDVEDEEGSEISNHFQQCYNFIEQCLPHANVLVHCFGGVSRSATIVIFYVMKKLKLSLELANKFVVSKRYQVSPNEGFWNLLKESEKRLQIDQKQASPIQTMVKVPAEFCSQDFPKKFANHIMCFNNDSAPDHGNLFLGQFSILKSHFLKSLRIKSILSVVDQGYYKRMKIKQIMEHEGITSYLWLDLKDEPGEDISKYFNESYAFIDEHLKDSNVLIHCQAGVSRSASVVIAYLIKKLKINYLKALSFVRDKRPSVKPNSGFELSLIELSEKVVG